MRVDSHVQDLICKGTKREGEGKAESGERKSGGNGERGGCGEE